MTQVLILLAALHGYHGTKARCDQVVDSLLNLAIYNALYNKENKIVTFDEDLAAIKEFNKECQRRKK